MRPAIRVEIRINTDSKECKEMINLENKEGELCWEERILFGELAKKNEGPDVNKGVD
jgi:hypothetical protein